MPPLPRAAQLDSWRGPSRGPCSRLFLAARSGEIGFLRGGDESSAVVRYVAFLRGINLGKRRLPMSRLKALFQDLRFEEVETFIASGNVLFTSEMTDRAKLEAHIAAHLESSLGYRVDTFVRTAAEVVAIGKARVFEEETEPGIIVHVGFLHEKMPPEVATKFCAIRSAADELRSRGREYYWLCRGRTSDSKIWTSPAMKSLRLPTSSMRNLTSVRKLIAKHLA
jgi:uncharacterized protein (DUF1697 family)